METLKTIAAKYDDALKKGHLDKEQGVRFLEDVQEGFVKDGLGENEALAGFIATAKALSPAPTNSELGSLLEAAADS